MSTHSITGSPPPVPTQPAGPTESRAVSAQINEPLFVQRAPATSPFDTPPDAGIRLTTDTPPTGVTTTTSVAAGPATSTITAAATDSSVVCFSDLALDVKHEIFRIAMRNGVFDSGVLAYAKAAKLPRSEVIEFLALESVWKDFGPRLRASTPNGMIKFSQQMVANATELRKSFESSAQYTAIHANDPSFPRRTLNEFAGIEFRFAEINCGKDLSPDLRVLEGKPIKLNADRIGRQRFRDEVLSALAQVPKACPVVLDATFNNLTADDLAALVELMKKNPCVVQLDLSNNRLCKSGDPCLPFADLFALSGSTTHLYLSDTGFNDATAAIAHNALANNPCLKRVDLRFNELTEDGAALMAAAVAHKSPYGEIHVNPALESVRLQNNRYGDYSQKMARAVQEIALIRGSYFNKEDAPDQTLMVAEIDGTGFVYRDFFSMNTRMQQYFERVADSEKL